MNIRFIYQLLTVQVGAMLFSACSNLDGQCLIKGEFTNLSEGELYFYMPEGPREKIDTVSVREGKFTYAIPDVQSSYSILLFPNMSEQVVFVEPDLQVQISANATQLRDIKIKGGEENKLMTDFRTAIRDCSPEQVQEKVVDFIMLHPTSQVSNYLLRKYLMYIDEPDLELIDKALDAMIEAQPQMVNLKNLQERIRALIDVRVDTDAPDFTVTDQQGETHKLADYKNKRLLLVFGATWADGYREQLRAMKNDLENLEDSLEVVNITFDYVRSTLRSILRDSIPGVMVSMKTGWQSEPVKDYQVKTLPTYILIDKDQRIVAREDQWSDIKKQIK